MGCSASLDDNGNGHHFYSDTAKMTLSVASGVPLITAPNTSRLQDLNNPKKFPTEQTVRPATCPEANPQEDDDYRETFSGEYKFVITEFSDPNKIKKVEEMFKEPEECGDLLLEGVGCRRRPTPKEKERNEQQQIIDMLRNEGLVLRPESRAHGGMRFEIVSKEEVGPHPHIRQLPPLHLRKRRKKLKKHLTKEDIKDKLDKAQERRKQQEEEKVQRLATGKLRLQEVATFLTEQLCRQKQKIDKKMDVTSKTREKQMKEIQERLKVHQEHADKVRRRKQLLKKALLLGRNEN